MTEKMSDPWQVRAFRYEKALRDIAVALKPSIEGTDYDPADTALALFNELRVSLRSSRYCQAIVDSRCDAECGRATRYRRKEDGHCICNLHYEALPASMEGLYTKVANV